MNRLNYLTTYFGVEDVESLSQELYDIGLQKLLRALENASGAQEEIALWITANDIGHAPSPEALQFSEARVYARMIRGIKS